VHLGDIDVEIADWVGLELALVRFVAIDLRQPRRRRGVAGSDGAMIGSDAGSSPARRKAIVERQERVAAEGDDDRLLLDR
jgi:hypothetical protein